MENIGMVDGAEADRFWSSQREREREREREQNLPSTAMLQRLPLSCTFLVPATTVEKLGASIAVYTVRGSRRFRVYAEERETQFEIDRDKAREALKKLDEQLLNLSRKETPKSRFTPRVDVDIKRRSPTVDEPDTEDIPVVSGSYLDYAAVLFVLLTVVNNIVFEMFIKPSVDGKGSPPATVSASLLREETQQAPSP